MSLPPITIRKSQFANPTVLSSLLVVCLAMPALAADKSGVSPNSISLPKGPGSIEGLGESFQPSLNTGTAKYGIGLSLPPGTAGHQPELALNYEGGGGNGPLGYGWSLPLSSIQRRTDKGIPTYGEDVGFPRSDCFINELREELVPQADGFWFCENEGAFIRYRFVASLSQPLGEGPGEGYWEGTTPNGTKLEFGRTPNGRIHDSATLHVFAWLLERATDTRGNVIEYHYRSLPGEANIHQKYLALVRYGPGAPPWTHFHFVAFEYEDRPDWFEDGRAGFLVRTGMRLRSIVVGTQGISLPGHATGDFDNDGTPDALNRRYELDYLRYAGEESHWSLLESVTLVGADGVTSLPPVRFAYTVCNPPEELSAREHWIGAIDEPAVVMDNDFVELLDVNADGLPDVLRTELGGEHTAWINQGTVLQDGQPAIRWSAPVEIDPSNGAAWNFDLASERTHLADMNGDGLADLVHKAADESVRYFANLGHLAWSEALEMAIQGTAPPAPFGDPDVRTADLDFDKRIDIIRSEDSGGGIQYRVWFNLDAQTYSPPVVVEPTFPFPFSRSGVQISDCNGDRVPDVARVQPDAVLVAAGLGYGRFAPLRQLTIPDATLDDSQIANARLIDINGDGLADLVLERATPGACWYWLNLGNYQFSPRKRITDLPVALSRNAVVRWADLNGNGTTDLVYADREASPRIQAIELGEMLGSAPSPNLLTRIENGIGRVTRIGYAPSTRFAMDDAAIGQPWPHALPFPVTVVSHVTVSDSLGHEYLSEFRYHDGYYDPVEKQFRGFARVEQIDVGDTSAPSLVSRSHFNTGHEFTAMKGKRLRLTIETDDGKLFTDETTAWTIPPKTLMTGINGQAVRFAHPMASVKHVLEQGRGTPRRLESESDYDHYGNPTFQANYGIVDDGDRSAFDDERITITEYALNLTAWIIRLPKRVSVQDENGVVGSRSEIFYDDETFLANNPGSVTVGNLTLLRDWIDPGDPTAFVESARKKYSRHGSLVALLDPLSAGITDPNQGHFRELVYDDAFHAYPVRETIHVGDGKPPLVFHAAYDKGLATMLASTDFNGHTTTYAYDGFARLTRVVRPYDTDAFPTTEYEYAMAVRVPLPFEGETGPEQGVVNYVETRQLDRAPDTAGSPRDHYLIAREFTDGLGRSLMSRSEAESAPGTNAPRVVVRGAVVFNQRQKPLRRLNPFFAMQTGSLDELLAYEHIEAPDWQGQFHENGTLVPLALGAAHQSIAEYDATLRTIRLTNPDGTLGRTEFEPLLTRSFDENDTDAASPHFDTPMVQITDGLGRLIRVDEIVRLDEGGASATAPQTWTTRYRYNVNDRLTRIIDAQSNVKELHYDGLQRKTGMNDPDAGIWTNRYDPASNLIETVDARGQRITYTYDRANRIRTEDYLDDDSPEFSYHRSPDVSYYYDEPAASLDQGDGTQATARNVKGALACVEDISGEEHSSFDARGRLEWAVKRILDPELSPILAPETSKRIAYKTAFEYDSAERVTRMIYPDNDEISYRYNARSLLDGISGGPTGNILSGLSYLPSSQQQGIRYGNGVGTTYAYDKRARLTRLHTISPRREAGQSESLIDFAYAFDNASIIREIRDQRAVSVVAESDKRRNTQTFAYDDLYRLTRVQYNLPAPSPQNGGHIHWRYDRLGNMLAQTSDIAHLETGSSVTDLGTMDYGDVAGRSSRVGRQPHDPPGPHALTRISNPEGQISDRIYPYDANGNMTAIDGLACTWDFLNRLVAVEDNTMRAEYTYDYTSRRITKRVIPHPASGHPLPSDGRGAGGEGPTTVIYVGKHFEVRDHDQPTKYVFNDNIRVARITGSLSTNARIQRLRLRPGWNLVSMAVRATDLADQLQVPDVVAAVYSWNPETGNYAALGVGTVPSGTVLWINATTNSTIGVIGTYSDPVNRTLDPGATYLATTGLEAWTPSFPSTMTAWSFTPQRSTLDLQPGWRFQLTGDLVSINDLPRTLIPGQALYVIASAPVELEVPDPALRLRYYHQDHLGSSSVMTDASGALIEETAFYPFGTPRHEHRPRQIEESFKFTQKERDAESGLHYFEARFLAGVRGRFLSVDPKYAALEAATSDPQQLNLYAYARNNPVLYVDPTGLDFGIPELAGSFDEIDMDATGEAIGGFLDSTWLGGMIKAPPKISDAASFSAGFGDAIIDPLAKVGGVQSFGMGFGKFTRLAFGINNVDETSSDYAGGGVISTALQFAVGAGEVKAALSAVGGAGSTTATGAIRAGAARTSGGGALLRTARPSELAATELPLASRGASTAVSSSALDSAGLSAIRAQRAAVAARNAQMGTYLEILQPIQAANLHLVKSGVHPSFVLNQSFKQADAIWMSRFGTKPPGGL